MSFKSWSIGLAILSTVVIYLVASGWYSDSHQKPSDLSEARDSVKADRAFAPPVAPVGKPNAVAGINGRWAGEIDMGRGAIAQFSFDLRASDSQLTGTALFPIGEGSIYDGKIEGNQLSFTTRHRMQSTGQTLVSRFAGEMNGGMIALNMQSEGVESKLIVYRVSRLSSQRQVP